MTYAATVFDACVDVFLVTLLKTCIRIAILTYKTTKYAIFCNLKKEKFDLLSLKEKSMNFTTYNVIYIDCMYT